MRGERTAPAAADDPGIASLSVTDTAHLTGAQRITGRWQTDPQHRGRHGKTALAAIGLLDRDFHVGTRVEPPHVGEHERAGGYHRGMDQRTVLPDLDLGLTVGDPFNDRALPFDLQGLFIQHLHAGDLRTGEHRVVEVDLARLQHRFLAGESPLGVGRNMSRCGHVVLPGLHLAAAHDPVTGIEAEFGIGRGVAAGAVAGTAVQTGDVVVDQAGDTTGLIAGKIPGSGAYRIGGHDQRQGQASGVRFDDGLRRAA